MIQRRTQMCETEEEQASTVGGGGAKARSLSKAQWHLSNKWATQREEQEDQRCRSEDRSPPQDVAGDGADVFVYQTAAAAGMPWCFSPACTKTMLAPPAPVLLYAGPKRSPPNTPA